jgi:hypothetical protein
VPGSDDDYPFPEGLPGHWESNCGLDCQQEWYEYYEDRAIAAWVEGQAGGFKEKETARLLRDEARTVEGKIENLGGTPGELSDTPDPIPTPPPSAPSPSAGPSKSSGPFPVPVPDAVTGVGPIVPNANDLGTMDLGGPFEFIDSLVGAAARIMRWDDPVKQEN